MLDLIRTRRSIRRFDGRPVSEEQRRALEEAALRAPTSHNHRPWDFVFVTGRDTLASLAGLKPHGASFLADAPLAVAVMADPGKSDVWVEDASIAAAFVQLTAHALGLGSCWVQVHKREHADGSPASEYVRTLLGAPPGREVLAVIGIGHPAATKPATPDGELLREKIHQERF